jgi:hypothetical protein
MAGAILLAALVTLLPATPAGAAAMKLWWDTFEDNNTTGWTFVQNNVFFAVDVTTAYAGTHSLKITGNPANNMWGSATSRATPVDLTQDYTLQFGFKWSGFNKAKFLNFGHIRLMLDLPGSPMLYDSSGSGNYTGHQVSSSAVNTYLVQNVWSLVTVHVRPSQRKYWVFVNGTLIGSVPYQAGLVPRNTFYFEDPATFTYVLSAWYDEFALWGIHDLPSVTWCDPLLVGDPENTANWAQPPDVPYHNQYQFPDVGLMKFSEANSPWKASGDNHRCMVASLAMVFNRFGANFPAANLAPNGQEEIAAAANTNDRDTWGAGLWTGTTLSDGRRAAHFSSVTAALTVARNNAPPANRPKPPGAFGYTWRDLGYSAVDGTWTGVAQQDSLDFAAGGTPKALERLIASGYPVMVCFNPPADWNAQGHAANNLKSDKDTLRTPPDSTVEGHCVVIIGYDNLGGMGSSPLGAGVPGVEIHDPTLGSYLWYSQQYFFGQAWKFGKFLFAAPWEQMWLSVGTVVQNTNLDGSALVTYPGPKPLSGFYPVTAQAALAMNGVGLQGGQAAIHKLPNITLSGDWDYSTWGLKGPAGFVFGGVWVKCTASGTLTPVASTSYPGYADKLGTRTTTNFNLIVAPPFKPIDLGHGGWPYGDYWWCADMGGGGGGGGLRMAQVAGTTWDFSALVANEGLNSTPPSNLELTWSDPTVAEKAPGLHPLGMAPIPPMSPGDTLRVHLLGTLPPLNSFGESFFDVFSEIQCTGDTPGSQWPQDENNYAVLAEYPFELDEANQAGRMWFRVENPETGPMNVALVVDAEDAAAHWAVVLSDSLDIVLPQGVPLPMPPGGSFRARVTVTPIGDDSLGRVHVEGWLYTPGLEFVREMGGITLSVKWRAPVTGVGPQGPATLALAPPRPNPFVRATAFHYSIPRQARVSLRVYDVAGRLVVTLADGAQSAGPHTVTWDGSSRAGTLGAGVYFCRLEVDGGGALTRRVVRLR